MKRYMLANSLRELGYTKDAQIDGKAGWKIQQVEPADASHPPTQMSCRFP